MYKKFTKHINRQKRRSGFDTVQQVMKDSDITDHEVFVRYL